MTIKKGAMFGLDARIALAIFGALSVISGAALYSAIQEAKVTAIITDLNEIGKAYEQYYLDTGVEPYRDATTGTSISAIGELTKNTKSLKNWNGPYLSNEDGPYTHSLKYNRFPDSEGIYLRIGNDNSWGLGGVSHGTIACSTPTICYVWIQTNIDIATANRIDIKIDGSSTPSTGKIRIYDIGDGKQYTIFYKYMASFIKNSGVY